jgi:ferritin-like protein
MQRLGTQQIDRRALLRRGAVLAGVAALALPATASAGVDEDLSEVRLVCATKRVTIGWYTRWIDAGVASDDDAKLIRALRKQEQTAYSMLAPLLSGTAPADSDFTFTYPTAAINSANNAHTLGVTLENMALGIELGSASRIGDPNVAGPVAAIAAWNAQHITALTGATSSALPSALSQLDASNQLAEYIS